MRKEIEALKKKKKRFLIGCGQQGSSMQNFWRILPEGTPMGRVFKLRGLTHTGTAVKMGRGMPGLYRDRHD